MLTQSASFSLVTYKSYYKYIRVLHRLTEMCGFLQEYKMLLVFIVDRQ